MTNPRVTLATDRFAQGGTRVSHSRSHAPFASALAALINEMNKPKIGGLGMVMQLRETAMSAVKCIRAFFVVCSLVMIVHPVQGLAQQHFGRSESETSRDCFATG